MTSTPPSPRSSRSLIHRRALALPVALGALSLIATPAFGAARGHAAAPVAFVGHYSGTATLLINNGAITISSVTGKGSATAALLGPSTVSGSGSSSASAECDPFSGTGSLTGAAGSIKFVVQSSHAQGCSSGETAPITVSFSGAAIARGGTGKDKGAKGTLHFKGSLHLGGTSGSQSGAYTVTVTGKLSVAG